MTTVLKTGLMTMDGRSIILVNIPSLVEDTNKETCNILLSPSLKHLIIWHLHAEVALFSLSKQSDYEHKGAYNIWTDIIQEIEGVLFSDDGKQFAVLLSKSKPARISLFNITDQGVLKENEVTVKEPDQSQGSLIRKNENICESSDATFPPEVLIRLYKSQITLFSPGSLSSFSMTTRNECLQNYFVSLPYDATIFHCNRNLFYCLDESGVIYIYVLDSGVLFGILDVYNIIPRDVIFSQLVVNITGDHIALLGKSNHLYIMNISSMISSQECPYPSNPQLSARVSSSTSVSSFQTSTSKTSSYSRKTSKKIASIANASSASSSWLAYLERLTKKKRKDVGELKECDAMVCVQDIPNNYILQSLHFCQDSIGIWATHPDGMSDGFYRVYDIATGRLESVDILAPDTRVICLDSASVNIDLFLQTSNLYLPLGIISRDTFIQKMVGSEKESQVGQMIGHEALPLPLLQEGLRNTQLDMVRLALNLHTQGFKSKISKDFSVTEELIDSTRQLFENIVKVNVEMAESGPFRQQVNRLALTHASTLLSLLPSPSHHASLQTEILRHVVLLRKHEPDPSVDAPAIPQWSSWLTLSDEEIILHSISSLPLVHLFLALHRGWKQEELEGQRFYNIVQQVFVSLLLEKKLGQATHLMTKVNLDPEKELQTLCLKSTDTMLRDYLATNTTSKLNSEHYEAWQFLKLVESVLARHNLFIPKLKVSSSESPMTISDVLMFTAQDKANVIADLYFSTGDCKLEKYLTKEACWHYLLRNNCPDGILQWIEPKAEPESSEGGFPWPRELFSQWHLDQAMIDAVSTADCTQLTKHLVYNKLAKLGLFADEEKSNPEKLVLRLAYTDSFPNVEDTLNQDSSNLKFSEYSDLMLKHAIQNDLVDIVFKSDLSSVDWNEKCPPWLKLYKIHSDAGKNWEPSQIALAIEETTNYLASLESVEPSAYLKQHPAVAIVTDLLKNEENICQKYSHVSPLLAAAVPPNPPIEQDVTIYSVLAHTVPFHTDNIFRHQISSKKTSPLPDFRNEKLSLRYGLHYSLGYKDFLKQGRPASAISSISQKGRFTVRRKTAVNCAHGMALYNAQDTMVTSSCIAFVELLGQDSSLIRTHVATARALSGHISDEKLKELLYRLVEGKEDGALALLTELERHFVEKWTSNKSDTLACVQDFHLAVKLAVSHGLPPPSAILTYSLDTGNWLLFMLAAQLFQYPLATVEEICTKVSKHNISKHLFHALNSNKSQSESVVKMFEPETDIFALLSHHGTNADLLFNLSRKLNCAALALIASSLQPTPVEIGFSSWLVASLTEADAKLCPSPPWSQQSTTQLLELVVRRSYFYTLAQGFFVYHPVNPLSALANFLTDCVVERSFKESAMNLKIFMAAFFNLSNEDKNDTTFMLHKRWIAITAYRMVCTALAFCFSCGYFRHNFLKTLCECQFSDIIKEGQSLPVLLQLSECLSDTALHLDWERLCLQQDSSQLSELLASLTQLHMFDTAFQFAKIAALNADNVLITQWSVLAHSDERKERDFWNRCEAAFCHREITPATAVTFYRKQAGSSTDLQERYSLLNFALGWTLKSSSSNDDVTSLQIELYMTCLQEKFRSEVITEGVMVTPLRCLSEHLVVTPIKAPPTLTSAQYHRLDAIINQLLIVGDIKTAFVLQSLFHHTNQDCELLLACMRLAEGLTSLSQLPARIQGYLVDDSVRRPKITFSSPMPRMRSQNNMLKSDDNQSMLNALYALQAHQTCTTPLFAHIISGFNISLALNCSYKEVILDAEPLNRLLPTHDFDVATSMLQLACLTRQECSQYVCSQIMTVLHTDPDDGKYTLWSCDLDTDLSCVLDLSGSPLLLGNLLLASDPSLSTVSTHTAAFRQEVEALVLAHGCFTRVCHMEGICTVLSLARSLTSRLLNYSQWPLMVRLLTGIGRYTEMNYVFQILKENDQFEFLLGKGSDKPQLMAATLEFVRHDKQLFSLVAHHFSMYSELAALYEAEARVEVGRLERADGRLLASALNHQCLQNAMSKYTDATEHYVQAKKMKCGVSSIQQAELIALQVSLLSNSAETSVPCLVGLNNTQAVDLINTVLSYEQAHLVASAYSISVDWSVPLYHNCVRRGDSSYFTAWARHHQLNKMVVQDVVRRFQTEQELNSTMEVNMKWFVSSIPLLDEKYLVASQLGFKDILQHLLNNPDMAYLKDTVWQSGYKKQML